MTSASHPPLSLVLLGTGLGVYTLATAFHAEYGIRSRIVTRVAVSAMRHSQACQVRELGARASNAQVLDALMSAGRAARRAHPEAPVLLLCNEDSHVEFLSAHREQLSEVFALTLPAPETLARIVDKAEFSRLCTELEVPQPRTEIVDFTSGAQIPPTQTPFPVVAKPAKSSDLIGLSIRGKKKVYVLHSQAELDAVWQAHQDAGYQGRFVVQELIPGDDTATWSITAYRDAAGRTTLRSSARVLLGEHTPDALGRPAAMITIAEDDALDQAQRILDAVGYHGFANFDLKEDPRDGTLKFFELNPRIGRNNYYVTAAGANISLFPTQDVLEVDNPRIVTVTARKLYSLVPRFLLKKYVSDQRLWNEVVAAAKSGVANPWAYKADGIRAWAYSKAVALNHVKKFRRFYPTVSETGF